MPGQETGDMAAHNDNCVVSNEDRRSTCFKGWDRYNEIIDEYDSQR